MAPTTRMCGSGVIATTCVDVVFCRTGFCEYGGVCPVDGNSKRLCLSICQDVVRKCPYTTKFTCPEVWVQERNVWCAAVDLDTCAGRDRGLRRGHQQLQRHGECCSFRVNLYLTVTDAWRRTEGLGRRGVTVHGLARSLAPHLVQPHRLPHPWAAWRCCWVYWLRANDDARTSFSHQGDCL